MTSGREKIVILVDALYHSLDRWLDRLAMDTYQELIGASEYANIEGILREVSIHTEFIEAVVDIPLKKHK